MGGGLQAKKERSGEGGHTHPCRHLPRWARVSRTPTRGTGAGTGAQSPTAPGSSPAGPQLMASPAPQTHLVPGRGREGTALIAFNLHDAQLGNAPYSQGTGKWWGGLRGGWGWGLVSVAGCRPTTTEPHSCTKHCGSTRTAGGRWRPLGSLLHVEPHQGHRGGGCPWRSARQALCTPHCAAPCDGGGGPWSGCVPTGTIARS